MTIQSKYPNLHANGFTGKLDTRHGHGYSQTKLIVSSPIHGNNDKPIVDVKLLEKMDGRLSNVAYMASEIDSMDGLNGLVEQNKDGALQYNHLLSKMPVTAKIYQALRRLQRDGKYGGVYLLLIMLLQYEDNVLPESAILSVVENLGYNEKAKTFPVQQILITAQG